MGLVRNIKEWLDRKSEIKELKRQIEHQAELEAINESKEIIKQKKLDKYRETKEEKMEKFAKMFSMGGDSNTSDKVAKAFSLKTNSSVTLDNSKSRKKSTESTEDKIKRMLG